MSIARHTAYNAIGGLLPIAVSLITVPLYLHVVGLDRYGVLSLFWLLVGYFNFFDFGIGRATAQHIATLHDRGVEGRSRAFWTGFSLSLALALVAALVAVPLGWIALSELKVGSSSLRAETQAALPLLIAAVPMAIIQSVLRGALEGRQQFLAVNAILSAGAVATGVLPLIAAAIWGPAIPVLVATSLGVRCFVVLGLGVAGVRAVPVRGYSIPGREDVRNMLRFGAWLTVSNIVSPFMTFIDRFLIGAILGPAAVALYVIPFNLVSQLSIGPSALSSAMFPRFAATEHDTARTLSRDKLAFLSFVLTPITIAALCLAGPFLHLWIGSAAATKSTPVALILMIGFWINSLAQLPYARLQAGGRTDITAIIHLAECLPYVAVLWACMMQFGIAGAAVAWSFRCAVDFVALALCDKVGRDVLLSIAARGIAMVGMVCVLLVPVSVVERLAVISAIILFVAWDLVRRVPPELHQVLHKVPFRPSGGNAA